MSTIADVPDGYPPEITGYAEPWIASPGERVNIKISCTEPEYSYRLVRVVQGVDVVNSPKKQVEVITDVPSGTGKGRFQHANPGSYGINEKWSSNTGFDGLKVSFYFQSHLPKAGHPQTIISTINELENTGFAVAINENGQTEVWIGTGKSVDVYNANFKARCKGWVLVTIVFSDTDFEATFDPIAELMEDLPKSASLHANISTRTHMQTSGPMTFAASLAGDAKSPQRRAKNFFNGRIDSPCLATTGPRARILAHYNFALKMDSDIMVDISGGGYHGTLINAPTRAVTGHDWDGSETDWTKTSRGYGAIHFHEDDLDDVQWETDLTISLPTNLRSGIYAVEVTSRENNVSDLITFILRPEWENSKPNGNKVALVLSTFTYLAYANEKLWDESRASAIDVGPQFDRSTIKKTEDLAKLMRRKDLGHSIYDVHRDGSGTVYSSAKRPILNFRPDYIMWAFDRPRELSAESVMIGFLERKGFDYDVVTDHDLHERGADALDRYKTVITGSHPEYPTRESYAAYLSYARRGGNLMYLGGNGFYWVAALDQSRPWRLEVRRGDQGVRTYTLPGGERTLSLNGTQGGLWRSRGRSSHGLFGVAFCGEGTAPGVPFQRTEAGNGKDFAWMFKGIGEEELIGEYGLGGGASGDEVDSFDLQCGSPHNATVVATSTGHPDDFGIAPECVGFPIVATLGTQTREIRSDIVFYRTNAGGAVFSVGSINWFCSVGWKDYDNNVAVMTENVLRHLLTFQGSAQNGISS